MHNKSASDHQGMSAATKKLRCRAARRPPAAQPTVIEMKQYAPDALHSQATWRYEFGHWMDYARAPTGLHFRRSEHSDFTQAMRTDASVLRKGAGVGRSDPGALVERRKELLQAYAQEQEALQQATDPEQVLASRFGALGLDLDAVRRSLRRHSSWGKLPVLGDQRNRRLCDLATACEQSDGQGLVAALINLGDASEWTDVANHGLPRMLSDLFGSATGNVVAGFRAGYGHTNDYYRRPGAKQSECFANLTCILGSGDLFFEWVVSRFTPKMRDVFVEAMQ